MNQRKTQNGTGKWVLFGALLVIVIGLVAIIGISVVKALLEFKDIKKTQEQTANTTTTELTTRANMQQVSGDLSGAEQSLRAAIAKENTSELITQLAVLLYREKKYESAIAEYQKLISMGKDPAFAWNGIGNSYRDWANLEESKREYYNQEAVKAYQEAIKADKGYIAAYTNLVILLKDLNQNEQAKKVANEGYTATGRAELKQFLQ